MVVRRQANLGANNCSTANEPELFIPYRAVLKNDIWEANIILFQISAGKATL